MIELLEQLQEIDQRCDSLDATNPVVKRNINHIRAIIRNAHEDLRGGRVSYTQWVVKKLPEYLEDIDKPIPSQMM